MENPSIFPWFSIVLFFSLKNEKKKKETDEQLTFLRSALTSVQIAVIE